MIFVCFSGEEQGLYGSEDYVADLIAAGDLARVQGVYVLDMIAFTAGLQLDCILESESFAQLPHGERPTGLPRPAAGGADSAHGRRRAPAARGLLGTLRRRFRVGGYAALERDRALRRLPGRACPPGVPARDLEGRA